MDSTYTRVSNVIILAKTKSDNINQMITKTDEIDLSLVNGTLKYDHIKRLITLTSNYIKRLSLYYVIQIEIYNYLGF